MQHYVWARRGDVNAFFGLMLDNVAVMIILFSSIVGEGRFTAEFVLTRPIFDVSNFEQVLKRIDAARLPVVAGIFPFDSVRNAEFMANEVPGVRVPEALMDRLRRADGHDAAAAEGVVIAREIAQRLRGIVQGIQVSTASGNIDAALAVIDGLR